MRGAKVAGVALAGLGLSGVIMGCGPRYAALAQHTLTVEEHRQKDVLWVVQDGVGLLRCENQPQGPVCVPVRTP